jgi:anti-anti-sigma factor
VLRIIQATDADGAVLLRLEGQVRGRWLDELRQLVSAIRQTPVRLVLDLAEVSFVDADGLALLHDLSSAQVVLRNCSLFVTQQLKALEEKQ